jgi:rare lipoprotein A
MFDRKLLSFLLFGLLVLSGCATQTPPPPAAVPAPPPQPAAPTQPTPYFTQSGIASFYGAGLHGKTTADGGTFDQNAFTAAHLTLAFGTVVRVTNLGNGRTVKVEINDRGPRVKDRIIDLSAAAARALGMTERGITHVRLEAFRDDQEAAGE